MPKIPPFFGANGGALEVRQKNAIFFQKLKSLRFPKMVLITPLPHPSPVQSRGPLTQTCWYRRYAAIRIYYFNLKMLDSYPVLETWKPRKWHNFKNHTTLHYSQISGYSENIIRTNIWGIRIRTVFDLHYSYSNRIRFFGIRYITSPNLPFRFEK